MRPFGAASLEETMWLRATVGARQRGVTLIEMLVTLMLIALLAAAVVPGLGEARGAAALRSAAGELKGLMFRCRAHAVMSGRASAVVFERRPDSSWRCYVAEDGDGDGIRRDDLDALRDPVVGEVLDLGIGGAGLGILKGEYVPDPSGRGRLRGDLDDPVRAGRGDIITFSPRGTATPSSVYLTDYHARMRVLRIYGSTGRVICRVWRSGWAEWREAGM
jgi:prepilin-type N-terminal cleavage/methylation domain-containing protein